MTAVDPDDIEQKSGVAYAINGSVIPKSMSLFKIHSKTGEIKTIKALDYEDMKEHILIIEAKDEEKNARTSLFSVVISVDDVNDHKPVFLKSDLKLKSMLTAALAHPSSRHSHLMKMMVQMHYLSSLSRVVIEMKPFTSTRIQGSFKWPKT